MMPYGIDHVKPFYNRRATLKSSEKKMLLKHIKKDDKEFRDQIKDDVKLKKQIQKAGKK
jgi:hypothetical protein